MTDSAPTKRPGRTGILVGVIGVLAALATITGYSLKDAIAAGAPVAGATSLDASSAPPIPMQVSWTKDSEHSSQGVEALILNWDVAPFMRACETVVTVSGDGVPIPSGMQQPIYRSSACTGTIDGIAVLDGVDTLVTVQFSTQTEDETVTTYSGTVEVSFPRLQYIAG